MRHDPSRMSLMEWIVCIFIEFYCVQWVRQVMDTDMRNLDYGYLEIFFDECLFAVGI